MGVEAFALLMGFIAGAGTCIVLSVLVVLVLARQIRVLAEHLESESQQKGVDDDGEAWKG